MQIKRFEAKNMTAALRLIKAELGKEAVILSARSVKKRSGIWGSLKTSGVEVTAATDTHIYTEGHSRKTRPAGAAGQPIDPYPNGPKNPLGAAFNYSQNAETLSGRSSPKRSPGAGPAKKYLFGLYQQLISQGVDADIAGDLTEGIKLIPNATRRLANGESVALLSGLLEHMGPGTEAIRLDGTRPRVVAFIGTSGVGKTTTLAKLAARFAVAEKKAVALITFDDVRIGALEQIRVYAKIIGIPLAVVSNRAELKVQLKRFKNMDLVMIDTPGLNPKNAAQIRDLQSNFEKLPAVQSQLVLSATTKETDLMDTLKRLEGFGQRRLIFTRLDETEAIGNLLNVLIRTNIPISYISDGQQIPDDIQSASLENLVRVLVHEKTASRLPADFTAPSKSAGHVDKSVNRAEKQRSTFFVANRNSDVYHVAGCKWTKKIKHDNMITFDSAAAAAHRNYLPCRNCNPDRITHSAPKAIEGDHHVQVNVSAY